MIHCPVLIPCDKSREFEFLNIWVKGGFGFQLLIVQNRLFLSLVDLAQRKCIH